MTELENRLRVAFRAKASQITPPVPPLELPPGRAPGPVIRWGDDRAWRPGWKRWLVPIGAALAVIAVIAAALAVGGALPEATPPAAPIQTSVPRYYVALISVRPLPAHEPQAGEVRTTATVRDTATGAVIARISPPQPYTTFIAVTAAADDRSFVLAALRPVDPQKGLYEDGFFQLRINPSAASPAGRATLSALLTTLPGDDQLETMALSPDGRSLAAVVMPYPSPIGPPSLWIYNLASGQARTWIRTVCSGQRCQNDGVGASGFPPDPGLVTLSWTQDGKSLAFVPAPGADQLRLLNVAAPGDEVTPDSKPFDIHGVPTITWSVAAMTPDGKTVFVACTTTSNSGAAHLTIWVSLLRFSARTGRLTTINKLTIENRGHYTGYDMAASINPDGVLWTSYDGGQVIVTDVRPGAPNAGIYRGRHYTPIPWPANVVAAAW